MSELDYSAVYHRDQHPVDDYGLPPGDWIFERDTRCGADSIRMHPTEAAALAYQRAYREAHGFPQAGLSVDQMALFHAIERGMDDRTIDCVCIGVGGLGVCINGEAYTITLTPLSD